MSVLINGMEMPEEGTYNIVYIYSDGHVSMPFWGKGMQIVQGVNAVEVVRCKDCRFYTQSNEKCELVDTRLHFYETDKIWTEDCFCSWGERRSE